MKLIMAILFLMVMINTVSHANESLRAKEPAPTTAPTPDCECPEKQGDARQRKTDLYRQ